MEHMDDLNRRPLKSACYCILTIVVGLISSSVMVALAYFTYQAASGNMEYCTLWTDVPGRLAMFITFYYAAGVCGILPIPERYRMRCLPRPFVVYKLKSWKKLCRNVWALFPFLHRRRDPEMSPLKTESSPIVPSPIAYRRSANIPIAIAGPSNYQSLRSNKIAENKAKENVKYLETSMSFDSSVGGQIVPMMKGRSSRVQYFIDSSLSTTESCGRSEYLSARSGTFADLSGTISDQAKLVARIPENIQPPTPDVEGPIPNHPRYPWSYLREEGDTPRRLHKRHLLTERKELVTYIKKQRLTTETKRNELVTYIKKQRLTTELDKDNTSESEWATTSENTHPIANRSPRQLSLPKRKKVGSHDRLKSAPANLRKLQKLEARAHKKSVSCNVPRGSRPTSTREIVATSESAIRVIKPCCESSTDLQVKVDYIRRTLKKFFERGSSTDK